MSDTTIRIEDIPSIEAGKWGRRATVDGYGDGQPRRTFLALAAGSLSAVGFASMRIFSGSRPAGAAGWATETQSPGGCQTSIFEGMPNNLYDPDNFPISDGNNNGFHDPSGYTGSCTDDACVGLDDAHMGQGYCVQCSEVDPGWNDYAWHFDGQRLTYSYWADRLCRDKEDNAHNAWLWAINNCGYCATSKFRCSDGWKQVPGQAAERTLCQGLDECNGFPYNPC